MRKIVMLIFVMMIASVMAVPAFAQGSTGAVAGTNWVALTSGFAIALAAGLAALGQGKVAGAACDSLGRNPAARPGIMVALILGLAFIEFAVGGQSEATLAEQLTDLGFEHAGRHLQCLQDAETKMTECNVRLYILVNRVGKSE